MRELVTRGVRGRLSDLRPKNSGEAPVWAGSYGTLVPVGGVRGRRAPDFGCWQIAFGGRNTQREDKATSTIPFIFLTARGEKLDVWIEMNCGADDYLTKPVGHEELLAAIAVRLECRQAFKAQAQEQVGSPSSAGH